MKNSALALALISALLLSIVVGSQFSNLATAQNYSTITIKADGSIDPTTAPIIQSGNVYKLTADIFGSIKVEKFNIVLDGAGFSLQGNNTGLGIQIFNPHNASTISSLDVTVKNFNIKSFERGISVLGYWGNNISGVSIERNNITNNSIGILFSSYGRYSNNAIIGNNIVGNNHGIDLHMGHEGDASGNIVSFNQIAHNQAGIYFLWMGDYYSWKPDPFQMNNRIYSNNFVDNSKNVVNGHVIYDPDCANIWDNGSKGNYWSDYNGTDSNRDGIGDTPYVIDANNIDRFPLMSTHISDENKPTPTPTPNETRHPTINTGAEPPQTEPIQTTVIIASAASVIIVGLGLLIHFRKRRPLR
ncbi:MAG: right-handed parallel beta-helix repeat-containing protein [Candidatus Bathyarchaeia archaeon]|jgi:parallel beta-helix repeat protein